MTCLIDSAAPPQISDLVRALAGSAGPSAGGRNPFRLTRRELDVVSAVALGETNKEVARHFSIAEETVKRHLSSIFDKLELPSSPSESRRVLAVLMFLRA